MKDEKRYTIKKTILGTHIQVILNDSMGVVAYFTFDEAAKMCQILNANSDSNCKYEIVQEKK